MAVAKHAATNDVLRRASRAWQSNSQLDFCKVTQRMKYFLLLSGLSLAATARAAEPVRSSLVVPMPSGFYRVTLDDNNALEISCVESCKSGEGVLLKEDVARTPMGIVAPYDDQNLLVTTWGTGSANMLIVYYLDGKRTRKVFEQYMLGRYDIIASQGGLIIRLRQFASERSRTSFLRTWQWDRDKANFTPRHMR